MKRFLKIVAWIIAVVIAMIMFSSYFMYANYRRVLPDCPKGHIYEVKDCKKNGSMVSYEGSGTSYFMTSGRIDVAFCRIFNPEGKWSDGQKFSFVEFAVPSIPGLQTTVDFKKEDCATFLPPAEVSGKICYFNSRRSEQFQSTYRRLIVSDAECKQGMYFYGDGFALEAGKPVAVPNLSIGE